MKKIKGINYKLILVLISIPIILILQYYLFKFGVVKPMVKGIEIEMEDGDYIKDIDKFIIKLNDTVKLSSGNYIIIPSYAKKPDIYFKNLDDSNILSINGNEIKAEKEGIAAVGIMKNSRVLKKINIKVVNPKVESLRATLDNELKYVGESANIISVIEVDYDRFKEKEVVTYESSDSKVLNINGDRVEAVGVGKATLLIKADDKEKTFNYDIQAKISNINIPNTITIYENETKKLKPKVTTSPSGLKYGKIKYELAERKIPIDYSISISKDGTIVGLKEGSEKVRITCGNKSKVITIKVKKESIIDKIIKNLQVNYEIIDGNLIINLIWDNINDITNYEIFLKNNSLNESDYKLFKSLEIDNENIVNNKVNTSIKVDLFNGKIPNLSLYVIGKNGELTTKPSDIFNINSELENIENEVIENLSYNVDNEKNLALINWDKLDINDITYSVYIRDNSNGEEGFKLYENNIEENTISIPLNEEYDIDIYVIGSKDGKLSKKSNIINVKK